MILTSSITGAVNNRTGNVDNSAGTVDNGTGTVSNGRCRHGRRVRRARGGHCCQQGEERRRVKSSTIKDVVEPELRLTGERCSF